MKVITRPVWWIHFHPQTDISSVRMIYYEHFVASCFFSPTLGCVENVTKCFLAPRTNTLITLRLVLRQECSNSPCFGRLSVWMLYMLHCGWCAVRRGSAAWTYSHPLISQWSMGWHMVSELLCGGGKQYINHTPVNSDAASPSVRGALWTLPIHQADDEGRSLTITRLTPSLFWM